MHLKFFVCSLLKLPGDDIVDYSDRLSTALKAAKKTGMKLWLGTIDDNRRWYHLDKKPDSNAVRWSDSNDELSRALITEIWERYSDDYGEQIAGWYYTNEIWNFHEACNVTDN